MALANGERRLLASLAHLASADLQAFQPLLAPLRAHAPRTGHGTHICFPMMDKYELLKIKKKRVFLILKCVSRTLRNWEVMLLVGNCSGELRSAGRVAARGPLALVLLSSPYLSWEVNREARLILVVVLLCSAVDEQPLGARLDQNLSVAAGESAHLLKSRLDG